MKSLVQIALVICLLLPTLAWGQGVTIPPYLTLTQPNTGGGGGGGGGPTCGSTVTLSGGAATVSSSCITPISIPLCIDNTTFSNVVCTPGAGSMTVTGTGSDVITWFMVNSGGGGGGGGGGVNAVTASPPLAVGGTPTTPNVSLAAPVTVALGGTGIVNPLAHSLLLGEGTGPVNTILCGNNLFLSGRTGLDPICRALATADLPALPVTGVTPGSYTNTNLTVGADGRLSAASNGSPGTGAVTSVTANAPLTVGGTLAAPVLSLTTPLSLANGGTGTASPGLTAGNGVGVTGSFPTQQFSLLTPVSIANGGTGSAAPGLTAGTGLAVSGSFPAQQFSLVTPVTVANGGTQCGAPTTVAGLPGSPTQGETCNVTDADTCTAGTACAHTSGSTACTCTWNGSSWLPAGGASSAATGGVTAVNVTAPITSTGGTTPTLALTLPLSTANGGTGSASPGETAGTGLAVSGTFPTQQFSLTTPVSIGNGGTGTGSPAGVTSGTGLIVTGAFPNQTVGINGPVSVANGGTGGIVAGAITAHNIGAAALGTNSDITSLLGLTTPLPVSEGGSGTTTPSLIGGTNVTISGSWPNQTVTSTGGGGSQPLIQHTLTEVAGAATMIVNSSSVAAFDDDVIALNAPLTLTTLASSSMAVGERILVHATTSGTSRAVTFAPGSGVTLKDSTPGGINTSVGATCTEPATGWVDYFFRWDGTNLELLNCTVQPPVIGAPPNVVANLPACTASNLGQSYNITDCQLCTFGVSCTGGGSAFCPETCSGSAWLALGGSGGAGPQLAKVSHTQVRGNAGGNYTTTSTSFVAVDLSNLTITATIPLGYIGTLHAQGTVFTASGFAVGVGIGQDTTGTTIVSQNIGNAALTTEQIPFAMDDILVGDGSAHTYTVNWFTTGGTSNMDNGNATVAPLLSLVIMPGT